MLNPLHLNSHVHWNLFAYTIGHVSSKIHISRQDTKPLVIGCYLGLVGIVYVTGIYSRDKYYFQITYIYLYSFSILKYIMQMFYTFWFWYKHSHFFPISFTMAPDSVVLSSVLGFFLMHMKALVLKPCIYCNIEGSVFLNPVCFHLCFLNTQLQKCTLWF